MSYRPDSNPTDRQTPEPATAGSDRKEHPMESSTSHETRIEPALALSGFAVFCSCGALTGFAHTQRMAEEIGAAHHRGTTRPPEPPPSSRILAVDGPGAKIYVVRRVGDENVPHDPPLGVVERFRTIGVNGKTSDETAIANLADYSERHGGEFVVEEWPAYPWANGARELASARGGVCSTPEVDSAARAREEAREAADDEDGAVAAALAREEAEEAALRRRLCPECGADLDGNDPHGPRCSRGDHVALSETEAHRLIAAEFTRRWPSEPFVADEDWTVEYYLAALVPVESTYAGDWTHEEIDAEAAKRAAAAISVLTYGEVVGATAEFAGVSTAPDEPRHVQQILDHIAHLDETQTSTIRVELNRWHDAAERRVADLDRPEGGEGA